MTPDAPRTPDRWTPLPGDPWPLLRDLAREDGNGTGQRAGTCRKRHPPSGRRKNPGSTGRRNPVDFAKQQAIGACGTCGRQEWEHQAAADDGDALDVLAVLGGACSHFTVSDAALAYAKHLGIANGGSGRKRGPRCGRCGNRGHSKKDCPL